MAVQLQILLLITLEIVLITLGQSTPSADPGSSSRILSRRKRYLIFPDGSSFQLVFCAQNQGYLQVGDIVWFGNTAALAWELPTDTKLFHFFKEHDKFHTAENRDGVSKLVYYLDEEGKVLGKKPYHKKIMVNPAFVKRSVDQNMMKKKYGVSIQELHENRRNISLFENLDSDAIDFHREGRKGLYEQMEIFIEALGWRGKECVLRLLCQSKRGTDQGTFVEEIIRATFTLPKGREFDAEEHKLYDVAHTAIGNCNNLYPQCEKL